MMASGIHRRPFEGRHLFDTSKIEIVKIQFCSYPEKRNHPGFVNISPTLVIDTSIERSLVVASYYSMETPKFELFF